MADGRELVLLLVGGAVELELQSDYLILFIADATPCIYVYHSLYVHDNRWLQVLIDQNHIQYIDSTQMLFVYEIHP